MALFSDASSTVHLVDKATVDEALDLIVLSFEAFLWPCSLMPRLLYI